MTLLKIHYITNILFLIILIFQIRKLLLSYNELKRLTQSKADLPIIQTSKSKQIDLEIQNILESRWKEIDNIIKNIESDEKQLKALIIQLREVIKSYLKTSKDIFST